MSRRVLASALLCLSGCPRNGDETGGFTSPGTSATSQGSSTGGSSGSSGSSTSDTEDSSAAGSSASSTGGSMSSTGVPDGGMVPDGGLPPPPGCEGKIDLLFVISSGQNMKVAQDQLKASFPGFIATIEQEFADFDYHIMVGGAANLDDPCDGCQDVCPEGPPDFPCGASYELCDWKQGAGITLPRGWNASNERCALNGGRRYITKGEPDLLGAFSCIAGVGTSGHYNVAEDAVLAVSPELLAPDGCNWGFLRDDALLVVTVITESDDEGSKNQPPDWAQALIDAKGGDGDAIVLLVVSNDNDAPQGTCKPYAPWDYRLRAWTELMPHALYGSICAPDFAPFLAEAAGLILDQCEVFIPQ